MEKLVILGSGCAGGTAAIYAARAGLKPIVFEGNQPGGQLTLTSDVENYPGFPEGIGGLELVENIKKQAQRFGSDYRYGNATGISRVGNHFELTIDGKTKMEALSVIVATGAAARWIGIESEESYKGKGVSACATCDGFFFKGKEEVIVIGGGDSACEEALTMVKFANHVSIIHRRDELRASKIMLERVKNHEKIGIIWDSTVEEILGDGRIVRAVMLKNVKTGAISEHACQGVFVAIGHIPNTTFLKGFIELDEKGFVKTKGTHTSMDGIFACGDVQDPHYKQAITSAGTGCQAAMDAERYLDNLEN